MSNIRETSRSGNLMPEPERRIPVEQRPVEIADLIRDNKSDKSLRRRQRFDEDEKNDDQLVIARCSDARYLLTYKKTITVPTIGAGGPRTQYKHLYEEPCVPGVILLPHLNCGGLGAKEEQQRTGTPENPEESQKYVHEELHDSDLLVQVAKSARDVSSMVPEKPVLAAVHNHETGGIYTIAVYRRGKPMLAEGKLPDDFQEFLENNANYISYLKEEYPELEDIQKVQNPRLLVLTRDVRPLEIVYPEITRRPGSVFRVLIPRTENGDIQKVDTKDTNLVISQAHYPIIHAIEHYEKPGTSFERLNRILIETESMDASMDIAFRLANRQWLKPWPLKPDRKIFIARTLHGELKDIDEFPLGA